LNRYFEVETHQKNYYFGAGSILGVTSDDMKLHVKLGVPHPLQQKLDKDKIKTVFP